LTFEKDIAKISVKMRKKLYLIFFALVLYTSVFLCHDVIFEEATSLYNISKETTVVCDSHQSTGNVVSNIYTHHKCPFCEGFLNDAQVQEIISINLFKKRILNGYIPSYIISLLIANPKRAPPSI